MNRNNAGILRVPGQGAARARVTAVTMKSLAAAARRLAFRIWRARVDASLSRADACRLFDLDLVIEPGVLHPSHFASSHLLASHLSGQPLRGLTVADMGTGSGLLALVAARAGAVVTALDISPVAVSCAAENARRNGLADRVSVLQSDVWSAVPPQDAFDLVISNPPFYPRDAQSVSDHAFAAGEGHAFFRNLADGFPTRLGEGGSVLLVHSSDSDFTPIAQLIEARGLRGDVMLKRRGLFETLTVRRFSAGPYRA